MAYLQQLQEDHANISIDLLREIIADNNEDFFCSPENMRLLKESKQQLETGQTVTTSWSALKQLANG